ncbi:MAG: hypothetical protein DRN11_02280 [Thermoplasmata archaeon]|nr:MAG: hypothetical protein DRN11_02280 [Thermoplasmata archaeon]
MNEFLKLMVYALLGIVYYFAGLRIFNKGRKNIVNLDAGRLQLYAILTAIVGLGVTYWLFNCYIDDLIAYLSFIPAIPLMARGGLMDVLDGRGQAGKKFNKILIVAIGVVFGFWLVTFLSGIHEIISISTYLPAIFVAILGFWMIGNRDDNLTRWGYGLLATALLIIIMQMGLFG